MLPPREPSAGQPPSAGDRAVGGDQPGGHGVRREPVRSGVRRARSARCWRCWPRRRSDPVAVTVRHTSGGRPAGAGVEQVVAASRPRASSGGPACVDVASPPRSRPDRASRGAAPGCSETATDHGRPSGAATRTSPPRLTTAGTPSSRSIRGRRPGRRPRPCRSAPRSSAVPSGTRIRPDAVEADRAPGVEAGRGRRRAGRERRRRRCSSAEVPVVAELHQRPAEQRVDQAVGLLGGVAAPRRRRRPAAGRRRPSVPACRLARVRSESSRNRLQVASTSATTRWARASASPSAVGPAYGQEGVAAERVERRVHAVRSRPAARSRRRLGGSGAGAGAGAGCRAPPARAGTTGDDWAGADDGDRPARADRVRRSPR